MKFPLASDPAVIDLALAGRKVFALIWTTTPWTLPANLGIAVHPDFEYVAFESGDEVYIVAAELLEVVATKCNLAAPKVLARFRGAKLDRLECRHAWLDRPSLLMLGEHVTLGGEADAETELDVKDAREKAATSKAGTGCVHTAPGHGHDDFVLGRKYGLEIYCPVDNAGKFSAEVEHFAGLTVFEANPKIVEFMRERGVLLFTEDYNHRYPHCWRCKNPVIFRATPQWFISMDNTANADSAEPNAETRGTSPTPGSPAGQPGWGGTVREGSTFDASQSLRVMALREVDERVKWIPAWGRERMRNMLKGRPDWCVSRQRVWGVPIPAFYCTKCSEVVADAAVIRHVADIFEKESMRGTNAKRASFCRTDLPARAAAPTTLRKRRTFSTSGSTAARLQSPCWRIAETFAGRRMFTSRAAISFVVGSIRL
ncbi:MAG: hypothetical protein DMF70_09165 [Acidobacteria bacterium]|nr:MAG: hypothetical protein DMF70_09165 [Acidobacteriota bacterium]